MNSTAGGNNEQKHEKENDERALKGGKMEYLVMLVIALVVIAYILNDFK